ncbi:hypothetical protein, partial [Corallococcus sp. AB049A]|uniref:hypothetical protein n=1 Tax=Corallococcus sp. AB049A TaxID=2316721 RepID=UPI001F28E93A
MSEFDILVPTVTLPRDPSIDPAIFAVARFYSEYIGPQNTSTPFIDFLPKFYDRPRLDPSFHHAVPAVALASASRQLNAPGLMIEAQRRYSQTLTSLA